MLSPTPFHTEGGGLFILLQTGQRQETLFHCSACSCHRLPSSRHKVAMPPLCYGHHASFDTDRTCRHPYLCPGGSVVSGTSDKSHRIGPARPTPCPCQLGTYSRALTPNRVRLPPSPSSYRVGDPVTTESARFGEALITLPVQDNIQEHSESTLGLP